ncbi:MAG: cobalamin-dependent protein [Acetobacterium sp.]|nr:cobalamin-dependent protein [Bacillota bacterium]MCG2730624.1 cobalamin-dependent protein [Acetobacterium sp.]
MAKISELLANLEMDELMKAVQQELDNGTDPLEILKEGEAGMIKVGELFSAGEYFVSDLMMSGEMFKEVGEMLAPHLDGKTSEVLAKVVLGTVEGDIHDIGKDLVYVMLKSGGFDVIDVGVDAKPEVFVNALKESDAPILALSCLLTTCYDSILNTVKAVEAAGLRDQVKIVIGGGPTDESVVKYTGADAVGDDAQSAVRLCKEML